ncbi:MAG: sugar phosphate isomerase/epimerase [Proteobacteria bacterium]|nr:sugar phosphate isomerase/epimerase [Pseudomonadota bacterium]MBU0965194.1 sugar phosphate isomerase/epimerase [Pseudomonadota bacterium]
MPMTFLKTRCFVNAPFRYLQENLSRFISEGIQPEIGLEGDVLYTAQRNDFAVIAEKLSAHNLSCTLHAPFYELYPGSLDPEIRRVSRSKIRKAFELIPVFKPRSIVCHLGFEENKHGYKPEEWFKYSLEAWQEFLAIATEHDTPLMLENTYEQGPTQHRQMLAALDSPYARFCLDVGHVLAFAKKNWHDWLPELEPWLGQLHLHDNHGIRDTHLAIGQGIFDFAGFLAYIRERRLSPIVTLEPHQENGVKESLRALDELGVCSWLMAHS